MATMKKIMEGWKRYEKEVLSEIGMHDAPRALTVGMSDEAARLTRDAEAAILAKRGMQAQTLIDASYGILKQSRESHPLATAGLEIILGLVPYVGQAIDAADFTDASLRGDKIAMTASAAGFIPIGGDIAKVLARPGVRKALGMGGKEAVAAVAKIVGSDPTLQKQLAQVAAKGAQTGRFLPAAATAQYEIGLKQGEYDFDTPEVASADVSYEEDTTSPSYGEEETQAAQSDTEHEESPTLTI